MTDAIIGPQEIFVTGPPETIDINVDMGLPGTPGGLWFFGHGIPKTENLPKPPKTYDVYFDIDTNNIWQYIKFPNNQHEWEHVHDFAVDETIIFDAVLEWLEEHDLEGQISTAVQDYMTENPGALGDLSDVDTTAAQEGMSLVLLAGNTWGGATLPSVADASTTTKGVVQLAGDLAGTAAAPTVRQATSTAAGKVELATTAEATAGTDTTRAVTPAGLKAVADTKAPALGTDDNYVTDAEKVKLANLSGTNTGDQDLSGYATTASLATQTINEKTGAYTLVATDAGKLVTLTLTVAAGLTVPANVFTAGQRVDLADRGTARVTVLAGPGMTVNPPAGGSLIMEGRYAYASLVFLSATEADLVGLVASA